MKQLHSILVVLLLSHGISAARPRLLFAREESGCSDPSFTSCSGSKLPSNFCCPADSQCIALNDDTSMICCPSGQDCRFIKPITCDITLQNATAHPGNPVQSIDLETSLAKCGTGNDDCCPQGYNCQDGGCVMEDKEQKKLPKSSTSAPASASASASASATGDAESTATTAASLASQSASCSSQTTTTAVADSSTTCPAFPSKAVVAGFFPGAIAGAILAAAALLLTSRKKKIGPPMLQADTTATRTDFLRRRSESTKQRSRSLLRRSEAASMEFVLAEPPHPPTTMSSTSTSSTMNRHPERGSHMTAFTDMMEGAGFRKGEPYLLPESRAREFRP
ncbi:MAG: hypothetical protein M1825_000161 [Sarcosagium campestre]|nr:MAG: hypothetical protein M1825_000161 [Sarcosagium campestre]